MLFLSIEGYFVLEDNNFQLSKIKEGWERSLSILRAEIGEATFKSWFKNIQFGETTTLRNIATKDELNVSCDKGVFAFIY